MFEKPTKGSKSTVTRVVLLLAGALVGYLIGRSGSSSSHEPTTLATYAPLDRLVAPAPTLVVYSFAVTDGLSLGNLKFFLHAAVREDDGCTYIIIVNLNPGDQMETLGLPKLPSNVMYVQHKNECYDWGTYAWALKEVPQINTSKYKYFIFMNSSIRGPFLHPMVAGKIHWSRIFTDAIDDQVKLVGPSISCENFCYTPPGGAKTCRQHPHIQSVAVATDQVGLSVLQKAGTVLTCQEDRGSAVFNAEIGSSFAIVSAGYNIASFLARYKGVDFRDTANHRCNGGSSPLGIHSFDGLTPGAFELVFPKVKESLLESRLATHVEAYKMSEWMMQSPFTRNVTANEGKEGDQQQRAADVLVASTKGMKCFDFDYYRTKNPDVFAAIKNEAMIFKHFLAIGMMEYREHKWKCELDAAKIIPKFP